MTTVAVLADPPRDGLVLPALIEETILSAGEATQLYTAALSDVLRAVEASGGDLLVNYRPEESIPAAYRRDDGGGEDGSNDEGEGERKGENDDGGNGSAESDVRSVAQAALSAPEEARFEVQVGESFAGRAGNTATYLLEREEVSSVAVVPGSAAFLERTDVDSAAMKLRGSDVVLGPGVSGSVYYAAFAGTIDFADAYRPPAVETLTDRALAADREVDFLPMLPTVDTPTGLLDTVSLCRARLRAGRIVPAHTARCIDDLGLRVEGSENSRTLARE